MANGHFAPQPSQSIFLMIRQVIHRGTICRQVDRKRKTYNETIKAWIRVAEIEGNPAGFLLNAEREPGSKEIELYQMATCAQYKRQLVATRLVDDTRSTTAGHRLYARCYPKSTHAYRMLIKQSFKHYNTLPRGTRELRFDCD
ncbi:hypothetical protein [Janthinobacterium lividum]|uniref:Uncharacterized protein n=1 Tax=Janthinobacterium lividum TaxID=29581 RepID=A0ABU0XRS6_9BURK|nr:hypothetical protein [Janthinobacterium lividum]MDQ4626222.1 hypothetical protein [Janthinobacterium lividum]MDQ4674811.1 hypothetical protein [Janthinobacterium lividum]MDQ4685543.1 hypothetical protein [Janthinobacterium lividum]